MQRMGNATAELYSAAVSCIVQHPGEVSRKQKRDQLSSFFGEEMLVIQVEDCNTLIGFKKFVARSLKIDKLSNLDTYSNLDNLVTGHMNMRMQSM